MAKLTALQIFNKIANNLRIAEVSALTGLTGENKIILNAIDHIILTVGATYEWNPLKTTGTITLSTDQSSYSQPSDYNRADRNSFRYNNMNSLKYVDDSYIDQLTSDQDDSGTPEYISERGGNWIVYKTPSSSYNGKECQYRYWKVPDRINTAVPTGTTWFPDGYDELVLVNLASAFVLNTRENQDKSGFYTSVGLGALNKMKQRFGNNMSKTVPVTAVF